MLAIPTQSPATWGSGTVLDIEERFRKFLSEPDENGCLNWIGTGTKSPHGEFYGYFRVGDKNRRAHRVAYEFANGQIPKGLVVRHKCDNTRCCNPDHLEIGTQKDNVRDTRERGRAVFVQGSRVGSSKLQRNRRLTSAAGSRRGRASARSRGSTRYPSTAFGMS